MGSNKIYWYDKSEYQRIYHFLMKMRSEGDGGLVSLKGAEIGLAVRPGDLKVSPLLIGDFLIIYIGLFTSGHSTL